MNQRLRFSLLLCRALSPVLVALIAVGCEDEFDDSWTAAPDTVQLFSLSRPELLGRVSAFDLRPAVAVTIGAIGAPVVVENPSSTGNWDVALTDQGTGLALVPASAFGGFPSRAGIAAITGETFDALANAPRDSASYSRSAVSVTPGQLLVIRSRRISCGFGASGSLFGKLEVLAVDPTAGTMRFRMIINPWCNDRRLISPE